MGKFMFKLPFFGPLISLLSFLLAGCQSLNTGRSLERDLASEPPEVISFAQERGKEYGYSEKDLFRYGVGFCSSFRLAVLEGLYNSPGMNDEIDSAFSQGSYDGAMYAENRESSEELRNVGPATYGYTKQRVSGVYVSGFEVSKFMPAESDEVWWLIQNEDFHEELVKVIGLKGSGNGQWSGGVFLPSNVPVSIKIQGLVSPKVQDRYGHLNQYEREVIVQNVISIDVLSK
jgi:hypothetical protein